MDTNFLNGVEAGIAKEVGKKSKLQKCIERGIGAVAIPLALGACGDPAAIENGNGYGNGGNGGTTLPTKTNAEVAQLIRDYKADMFANRVDLVNEAWARADGDIFRMDVMIGNVVDWRIGAKKDKLAERYRKDIGSITRLRQTHDNFTPDILKLESVNVTVDDRDAVNPNPLLRIPNLGWVNRLESLDAGVQVTRLRHSGINMQVWDDMQK
ncbi:MAG: hypothetical protein FWD87_09405 [Spirochaetaceae bacterium]|nr:hypothetical protein [Spirochaetaceae bacterium]